MGFGGKFLEKSPLRMVMLNVTCCQHFMYASADLFLLKTYKRTVAPTTAMVDNKCPVRLQTQLTGEEERDELED